MVTCKNCTHEINSEDNYCNYCGEQITNKRITLKNLLSSLFLAFGWDNKFFTTLRFLLYKPQVVLKEYFNGARKKYANPFSFFLIVTAVSLFVFSQFSKEFTQMSVGKHVSQGEIIVNTLSDNAPEVDNIEIFGYKNEAEFKQAMIKFQLKYYNLIAFLFLPIYTFFAFFIFRKPYNFGEHLIINTYIQGTTTFFSLLIFLFNLISGIDVFGLGIIILPFIYYCFVYKKLYDLTFGKLLLKALKFLGIFLLVIIISVAIGFFSVKIKG